MPTPPAQAISYSSASTYGQAAMGVVGSAIPGEPEPVDLSLAFKLHSKYGASRVILLDFTGEELHFGGMPGCWGCRL